MSFHDRRAMQDELIRIMGEREDVRALREQKERIQREREKAAQDALDDIRAANLRNEIEALGEKPCA